MVVSFDEEHPTFARREAGVWELRIRVSFESLCHLIFASGRDISDLSL